MSSLSIVAQGDSLWECADLSFLPRPICAINTAVLKLHDCGIAPDIWAWQDDASRMDKFAGHAVRGRPLTVWTTTVGLKKREDGTTYTREDQARDQFGEQPWSYEDLQIPRTVIELSCSGWTARWSMPTVHAAVMCALRMGYTDITVWFADMHGKNAVPYGQDERPEDYYPVRWVHERNTLAWCMRVAKQRYGAVVRRRGHTSRMERPIVNWWAEERIFIEKKQRLLSQEVVE